MLSICIPIYNFDINKLIEKLEILIEKCNNKIEIIVIDDCSNDFFKNLNIKISIKYNYIQLDKNVGRAKIRNLFVEYAKFENLLFLDCDSVIIDEGFLEKYIIEISKNCYDVICGGRIYNKTKPNKKYLLNWKYGTEIESKSYDIRQLNPYNSFMTNNFVIKKNVFDVIKFNENITKYGHEDTLFGFDLKNNNFIINHIKNPILNGALELNNVFLHKSVVAIENLCLIIENIKNKEEFIENILILDFYKKNYPKLYFKLIKIVFLVSKKGLKFLLTNGMINLTLFNFYKLGILSEIATKKRIKF